jgi:protein deglycase
MIRKVLVPVAAGTEDIELSCITDILVRGGVDVVVANVMMTPESETVVLARKLEIKPSIHISQLSEVQWQSFDGLLIPGGMPGATHIAASVPLKRIAKDLVSRGRLIGAICASPAVVLGPFGLLRRVPVATCYPAFREKLPPGTVWVDERVVLQGNVLTSQGPGTSIDFALVALSILCGREKALEVAAGLLVPPPSLLKSKV